MQLPTKTLLALLPYFLRVSSLASGTGTTTRYWDCCKPSCAWPGKTTLLAGSNPVTTCDISDNPLTDYNVASGCSGGDAYMCSNESPWAVSDDLAYGYAAVNIAGGSEDSWCCACYELTFTSGSVAGKKMIVQATNTGGDLGSNQFDISMPGGGVGIFNGCTTEWGAPSSGWGAQYGGISSRSDCDSFPAALQAGCYWRFDWFESCDNPTVSFTQVACPAAITKNSGCTRADDSSAPAAASASGSAATVSSSTIAAVVASSSSSETPVATSATQDVAISSAPVSKEVISSTAAAVETATTTPLVYYSSLTYSQAPASTSSAALASTSAAGGDDACEL